MNPKRITPTHILWLDLEMTGLDPTRDLILEVGAIITDWDFNQLESFETGVKQDLSATKNLLGQNPFAASRPTETEELIQVSQSGLDPKEAEQKILSLVDKHFPAGAPALLAGNSIHMDRQFIRHHWPLLEERLHYRMLDVSAWKVVMQGKYGIEFEKSEAHRALGDIQESIAELKNYLNLTRIDDHA